jgi:hypothetical protein
MDISLTFFTSSTSLQPSLVMSREKDVCIAFRNAPLLSIHNSNRFCYESSLPGGKPLPKMEPVLSAPLLRAQIPQRPMRRSSARRFRSISRRSVVEESRSAAPPRTPDSGPAVRRRALWVHPEWSGPATPSARASAAQGCTHALPGGRRKESRRAQSART